jgi:hypothetical protein
MLEQLIAQLPEAWRQLAELLLAPVAWIPGMQQRLAEFFFTSSSPWIAAVKFVLLLLPALLGLAAVWCTQIGLYTLPFRSGRGRFVSLMLLAWWDVARALWLYWAGLARFLVVGLGWALVLGRLAVRLVAGLIQQMLMAPLALTGNMTRRYLQPGVPWAAFVLLVGWCAIEAGIFAYILYAPVGDALANLVGSDDRARLTAPVLYLILLLLITGSFACVQTLVDAFRRREGEGESPYLVQVVTVELFVMFVEVMFLYRELVVSAAPWLVQAVSPGVGLAIAMLLGAFAWVGVRTTIWILFGQYGTPPLLALLGRQPLTHAEAPAPWGMPAAPGAWWRVAAAEFHGEIDWLHERSDQLLEYLALPVLHLVAAALNVAMILIAARPAFSLPFKGLREVTETRDLAAALQPTRAR